MKIFDHFKIPYNKEEIAKRLEEEEEKIREEIENIKRQVHQKGEHIDQTLRDNKILLINPI
jgi:hypothetical protein